MGEGKTKEMTASLPEAGIAVICIDEFFECDWSGRLYVRSSEEPYLFHGTLELLEALERFYDKMDYPQVSVNPRSFESTVHNKNDKKPEEFHGARKQEQKVVLSREEMEEKRGKRATFFVRIQYRQRATWQGQITWVEQQKKAEFRSILELLKIMDQTEDGGEYHQWSEAGQIR